MMRPRPADFVDVIERIGWTRAAKHYGASLKSISRWAREIQAERGSAPRKATINRQARRNKPYRTPFKPIEIHRDRSLAGLAASFLQRRGPVHRCGPDGKYLQAGIYWNRGGHVLTDADIIDRATRLGWKKPEYMEVEHAHDRIVEPVSAPPARASEPGARAGADRRGSAPADRAGAARPHDDGAAQVLRERAAPAEPAGSDACGDDRGTAAGTQSEPHRSLIGHNSERTTMTNDTGAARLRLLIERIERLEEEKKGISDDIKDVYAEAKATGYDVKAMRQIVRERRISEQARAEAEAILDTYRSALGMLVGTPLGDYAVGQIA